MESESDQSETPELLKLSDKITVLPIVYGSGEFSKIVIEWLLTHQHDCLAVPLPPSFQEPVESAVLELPTLSVVLQHQTSLNWEQGEKASTRGSTHYQESQGKPTQKQQAMSLSTHAKV